MADGIKVSELDEIVSLGNTDELYAVQSGLSKKIKKENLGLATEDALESLRDEAILTVDTLAELQSISASDGRNVRVGTYYSDGTTGIGKVYRYSSSAAKSSHNGGTIISPTVVWDGATGTSHTDFLAGVGESDPGGNGCWVLQNGQAIDSMPEVYAAWFGEVADDTIDDAPAINKALSEHKYVITSTGRNRIGEAVQVRQWEAVLDCRGTFSAAPSYTGYLLEVIGSLNSYHDEPDQRTKTSVVRATLDGNGTSKGFYSLSTDNGSAENIHITRTVGGAFVLKQVRETQFYNIELRFNTADSSQAVLHIEDDNSLPDICNNLSFFGLNMRYNNGEHIYIGNKVVSSPRIVFAIRFFGSHIEMSPVADSFAYPAGNFIEIESAVKVDFVSTEVAIIDVPNWTCFRIGNGNNTTSEIGVYGGGISVNSDGGTVIDNQDNNCFIDWRPTNTSYNLGAGTPFIDPFFGIAYARDISATGRFLGYEFIAESNMRTANSSVWLDTTGMQLNGTGHMTHAYTQVFTFPSTATVPAQSSISVAIPDGTVGLFDTTAVASLMPATLPDGIVYNEYYDSGILYVKISNISASSIALPGSWLWRANVIRII